MAKTLTPPKRRVGAKRMGPSEPKDLSDVGVGAPPEDEDPKARAEYFMQMLDAFGQIGTSEAKRLRSALIEAISEFSKATEENKDEAVKTLKARMYGIEAGVLELIIKNVTKIRDKIGQQARRMGSRSPGGKNAHAALNGLSKVLESLELMQKAGETASREMRDKANEVMREAREIMEGLGA